MKALFVDTAGWVACADGADPAHGRCCEARDCALEAGQTLVTTDYVVDVAGMAPSARHPL
jgi:predicted nucleic acid-binding protein